jgi:hypothetical protein
MSLNKKTAGHKISQTSHQVTVLMIMIEDVKFGIQGSALSSAKFFK